MPANPAILNAMIRDNNSEISILGRNIADTHLKAIVSLGCGLMAGEGFPAIATFSSNCMYSVYKNFTNKSTIVPVMVNFA